MLCCQSSEDPAAGFALAEQSQQAVGQALAGVAAGKELSYSFWNPAIYGWQNDTSVEMHNFAILY